MDYFLFKCCVDVKLSRERKKKNVECSGDERSTKSMWKTLVEIWEGKTILENNGSCYIDES